MHKKTRLPASAKNLLIYAVLCRLLLNETEKDWDLQEKQMRDTQKMDKYKVYGELINTYGYNLESGCKSFSALNYYTNEEITIPLDSTMTPRKTQKNTLINTTN